MWASLEWLQHGSYPSQPAQIDKEASSRPQSKVESNEET